MKKSCYILLLIFAFVSCTSTTHLVSNKSSNRSFVPLPIPILKCYCYMDGLHINIMDSVFFRYYYVNVPLRYWREFEIIDLVSGTLMLNRYTIHSSEQFRTINRRISRLFLDEIMTMGKSHRVVLKYYLNGKRIASREDAFRLATLNEKIDDIIIDISESRDVVRVDIRFPSLR